MNRNKKPEMNANPNNGEPLIEIRDLKKYFDVADRGHKHKKLKAVDGVSFSIKPGETLGLVGESGCGKTTVGRTMLRLYEPTQGEILYRGQDITKVKMLPYRRKLQYIFQDPYASLNPRLTVSDIVGEPIDIHKLAANKKDRADKIANLLELVGLSSEHANRYPHEFSGGQRQRIGIARALAVEPEFIVCDEPVSALDVSIQAQILNMLENLQHEMGFTYLFIAHDLAVVKHISDRIGVMYLGRLVELFTADGLHKNPQHPYTRALLSAIPVPDPEKNRARKRIILEGDVPNPLNPPPGCPFSSRCAYCKEICTTEVPTLEETEPGHYVSCHFAGKI
ncbi:MAG: ATP-binding cassette domain-containing protein [Eubacteriales bacterium]|jgi:oligopeptide transport system ATP-binding protein|nr:ATP-binding cassette domain-containing protein [Eubacteriales bacterium]